MLKKAILLFLLISTLHCKAGYYYNVNNNCKEAFENIIRLRLNTGKELLEKEKKMSPQNLVPYFLENYIHFFSCFITEQKSEFIKLKSSFDERIDILKQGPKDSPFFLFSQAQVNLQTALVRFKFKEYATGAYEIRKCNKLLEENQRLFPNFKANLLFLGLLHTLLGTVPEEYRWIGGIVGLRGSIKQGMNELNIMISSCKGSEYEYLYSEGMLTLALLNIYLQRDPEAARNTMAKLYETHKGPSPLVTFMNAAIAIHSGHSEDVIDIYNRHPTDKDYLELNYLDYQIGQAKLFRMDKDAFAYFTKYNASFKGQSFIKSSYQKIAWSYLIQGDLGKYKEYINYCKTRGYANIDEDKQALNEAESGEVPNIPLLRARLLFDGGYYNRALAEISGLPQESYPKLKDKLELTYRMARIYDKMGKHDKAIELYEQTIKNGEKYKFYFAANSALELGLLFEKQNNKERAVRYFRKCLTMRNHEYQNGIDQKAKAGLGRFGLSAD